jgi:lysozyme
VPRSPRDLAPVVDLELLGNCDPPPAEDVLRDAVVAFVDRVEQATGRRVVVYAHPDLEARYDVVDVLDRERWVRRPGDVPPPGDWLLWQRSDDARVDGVDGPVDLDVLRVPVDGARTVG